MASQPNKVNRPWVKERKAFERKQDNSEFYNSRAWRKLRKIHLDKFPMCVECERKGIFTVATVGDHKVRIEDGGGALDPTNIQSMCARCHNSKSGKEAHAGRGGMGSNH